MQIVIDMPEEVLNSFKTSKGKFICENGYDLIQGIKDGTPLPKGHGRLIDADELYDSLIFPNSLFGKAFKEILDDAPTIIEADKAESED